MIERKTLSRKVQAVGYSFFISLPLEWIQHHRISKNDRIRFSFGEQDELIAKPVRIEENATE